MGNKPSKHKHYEDTTLKSNCTASQRSSQSVTLDGRQYHNVSNSSYFMPRDEAEQDRLNSQHFSIKAVFGGNIMPQVLENLPTNAKILDIGCGSGSWVMEVAIDHPSAQVIGVDMADMFPMTIRPENVRFQLHNVLEGLPYEDASFDFVHMRLMLGALRTNEWPEVLIEIDRVLKPGGSVQLVEGDFTETSQSPLIEKVITAFHNAMYERDQDPWIASKLKTLLEQLSYEAIHVETRKFDYSKPEDPIAQEMLWNWRNTLRTLRPALSHRLVRHPDEFNDLVDEYIADCTRFGWYAQMWSYCARKPT
ncbi:hypothetical protein EC973_001151 [Apophysomyces ossiformis]|uniref:Methyltransferase domain-containing protein n=1 Tax=Apophysomyces ossiformis TaxID=679940 RepID=A0A8H7ENR5_9FUNG|nr:hypothetical protein EC973_001151 [Apophysomyces ossiformis]